MPLRALTLDFWNTMVIARTGGAQRQQQRIDFLRQVAGAHRPDIDDGAILAAIKTASGRYLDDWRERHVTPQCAELVGCVWEALGIEATAVQHDEAVRIFEEGLLFGPPDFAEGLEEALAWAAARYRLGIISDTMFSPGRVIRQLLHERGVLGYFDAFVFSDEAGFSKPDARAFVQAGEALGAAPGEIAHIGDLRRTDVAGARQAGLHAILFTGVRLDDDDAPDPDAVLPHWNTLPDVLAGLSSSE